MKLVLTHEYTSCTTQLCKIREKVRITCAQMGFKEADINLITLVIDEACSNIIRYAYCGDKSGRIILEIFQAETEAIFHLQDFAKCITASCLEVKEKKLTEPGGLGLKMMHQVMDSVTLLPPTSAIGNILELKKRLPEGL